MKKYLAIAAGAALSFTSAISSAADYTQVQIGAGAMYFGLFERDSEFEKELKSEERTKPSVSIQVSGQIFERSKTLWFDMFFQQTGKSYAEFQSENSEEVATHEASFSVIGLGARLIAFPHTMLKPFVKTGVFSSKIQIEETFQQDANSAVEKDEATFNDTGYYLGGGLLQRINNQNSISADYTAYKVDKLKNFQHNFQIGWVFHF